MTASAGHTIALGDLRVHLIDQGTGEPVVFLHGLGADHRVWRRQLDALSEHYRCIAPDMRGAGGTNHPSTAYTIALFADDVVAICRQLGIPRAHIVGQSLGGIVAQRLAACDRALVASLVLVGSAGRAMPPDERPLSTAEAIVRSGGMAALPASVRDLVYTRDFQARCPDEIAAFDDVLSAADPDDTVEKLRATAGFDHREMLSTISVPTLVVTGRHDGVFPPRHAASCSPSISPLPS